MIEFLNKRQIAIGVLPLCSSLCPTPVSQAWRAQTLFPKISTRPEAANGQNPETPLGPKQSSKYKLTQITRPLNPPKPPIQHIFAVLKDFHFLAAI